MREVREVLEDGIEAALINLDQSKAFDKVDHRFLATVLKTARFRQEFCKWISMMYHNPQAVLLVKGNHSEAFVIEQSVQQGCSLSPLFYVHALDPLVRRLRDEEASPALRRISFAGPLAANVSAYADDITVFVSHRLNIKAVKITGAEVCGWVPGGMAFLCQGLSTGVKDPSASSASSWCETGRNNRPR